MAAEISDASISVNVRQGDVFKIEKLEQLPKLVIKEEDLPAGIGGISLKAVGTEVGKWTGTPAVIQRTVRTAETDNDQIPNTGKEYQIQKLQTNFWIVYIWGYPDRESALAADKLIRLGVNWTVEIDGTAYDFGEKAFGDQATSNNDDTHHALELYFNSTNSEPSGVSDNDFMAAATETMLIYPTGNKPTVNMTNVSATNFTYTVTDSDGDTVADLSTDTRYVITGSGTELDLDKLARREVKIITVTAITGSGTTRTVTYTGPTIETEPIMQIYTIIDANTSHSGAVHWVNGEYVI